MGGDSWAKGGQTWFLFFCRNPCVLWLSRSGGVSPNLAQKMRFWVGQRHQWLNKSEHLTGERESRTGSLKAPGINGYLPRRAGLEVPQCFLLTPKALLFRPESAAQGTSHHTIPGEHHTWTRQPGSGIQLRLRLSIPLGEVHDPLATLPERTEGRPHPGELPGLVMVIP